MPFLVAADAAAAAASKFLEAVVPTVVARVSTLAPFDDPHVCAVRRSLHRVRRVGAGLSCLVFRVSAWLDSIARALRVCAGLSCLVSRVSAWLDSIARALRVCAGLSCLVFLVSAWFDSIARALRVYVLGCLV